MKTILLTILGTVAVGFSQNVRAASTGNAPSWQLVHWGPCLMQEEAYGYKTGVWTRYIPHWGPDTQTACLRRIPTTNSQSGSNNGHTFQCRGAASSIVGILVGPDRLGRFQISFEVIFATQDENQSYKRSGLAVRMPDGTFEYRDTAGTPRQDSSMLGLKLFNAKNNQAPFSVLNVNGQTIYESCRIN